MTDTTVAREKLSADFRAVMSDIDALMSATTNKAEAEASALRTRISERLDHGKERAVNAQHEAFKRRLYEMRQELLEASLERDGGPVDRVVQVNFQLFPLARVDEGTTKQ